MTVSKHALAGLACAALSAGAMAQMPDEPEGIEVTPEKAYLLGVSYGRLYREQMRREDGTSYVDLDVFEQAVRETVSQPQSGINDDSVQAGSQAMLRMHQVIRQLEHEAFEAEAEANETAGKAWIDSLRNQQGVVSTDTGLLYKVIERGTGARPTRAARVRFSYEERTIDGTLIDSSPESGPGSFYIASLVPGLRQGLPLMPVGSTFEFYLPPELAFGKRRSPDFGPNSALQFTVTLEGID